MRQPFQVLVIPWVQRKQEYLFGVFLRTNMNVWQFIAGGGEDEEIPIETAIRESREELNLQLDFTMLPLDSLAYIPGIYCGFNTPYVIPEYCFATNLTKFSHNIKISPEHREFQWLSYEDALDLLEWDSNKTALYELNARLEARRQQ